MKSMTGKSLRDKGIAQAVDHADAVVDNWSRLAYAFLERYCRSRSHREFMIEDVRKASIGIVPEPPSKRAWGPIAMMAVRNGLIVRSGYRAVTNKYAHYTPATVWAVQ